MMDEHDALDEFLTKLEEMGIITGWSKFMGREDDEDDKEDT